MNHTEWQRVFYGGKPIFVTIDGSDHSNYYESEEAAQTEVKWRERHNGRGQVRIGKVFIHSLELAKDRWERDLRETAP